MKAYGYNIRRNGTRVTKFGCCDTRHKCRHASGHPAEAQMFKRRARAEAKAQCKETFDD